MTRFMLTSAALALMNAPVLAQDAASGDQQMRDTAIQSAQGVGLQDVRGMEGAIVLEASTSRGMPVLVVVGPAGELLGLATPVAVLGAGPAAGTAAGAEGASAELLVRSICVLLIRHVGCRNTQSGQNSPKVLLDLATPRIAFGSGQSDAGQI